MKFVISSESSVEENRIVKDISIKNGDDLQSIFDQLSTSGGFVSDLFIIPLGDIAMVKALGLAMQLRNAGKVVEIAFGERALKGAMKAADKSGARYVVVLGDNEIATKSVELKNMNSGVSTSVTIDSLNNAL